MAEDGEQEKEYKIIISKQNSQIQQITVFMLMFLMIGYQLLSLLPVELLIIELKD